jgi:hypothetical protein
MNPITILFSKCYNDEAREDVMGGAYNMREELSKIF